MRLGKVLKGLVIVLCAVLVCAPAAAVDPVTCLFDFDEDGDIDGRDLVYFAAGFDGNDLDLFAEFFGNGGCQPLSSAPPDVDWGIAVDEQQGGGGLVGQTVRILNGNSVVLRRDVFFASAHSHGLIFTASYNSRATTSNALDAGWSHTYSVFLNPAFTFDGQSYLKIVDGTGRGVYFTQDTGVFRGAFHERTHVSLDAGTYVWHRLDGSRYGFSQAGVLLWIEDEKGNRLELGYDALDRLASVVDVASGRALSLHYNEDNHIESIAGPLTAAVPDGIWVSLDYDASRNLSSVTYADGSGFFYSYTDPRDGHNLTEMRNRAGHLINTWAYDDHDRCVENFNFRGNGVAVAYVSGYTVAVTDAYGVQRTYSLRSIGGRKRVSTMQGPASPPYTDSNVTRWVYDERMNLIEVELSGGTVHRYENFDERANPQTVVLAFGTAQERIISFSYHPRMNAVLSRTEASLLGPGNKVTVMDYDDDGNDIPNENPTNIMHRLIEQGFSLNLSGVLTAYEYITQFAYSDKGQVLSIDGPLAGNADTIEFGYDGISADLRMVTRPLIGTTYFLEYDAAGQAGKIIDVNNQSTRLSFDGRGRLTTIFYDADSSASAMTYNIAGLPEVSSDEDRIERYYTYDALYGRLDRIYDVDNNYIEHQYDLQGNLIERSRHDAAGARFGRKRFSFAGAEIPGKLYREINFDDTYTEYHYDGAGNVSLMTDAEGNVTEYRYDALNRLTEVIQSLDEGGDVVTSYRHDAHGNMASVTDAEGRRTAYEHDDMGRVVAIISADTGTTRYAYDGAGNLVRKTDANGITTQYGYDSLNRLKDIKFPDITQNITYTYDQRQNGVGYRTGMADASGNTLFGYDPRGRLVFKFSTVNGTSYWVGRAFTPAGRVQSVIYPSGRRIDYARNGSGKIKAMTTALNGQMTTLVSGLEHNPFGGPAGMNTGYGGAVNNRSGECACLEAANPGAFMEQNYIYDGNRNLLSIRATNTPWLNQDFYYDALNRLIRAGGIYGTIEYTYDKVGNRLTRSINDQTETYRYFPGSNRLSEVGGAPALSYTYDLNGNITGVDDKTLIYNQNNRLIQVKKNDTILGEYTYNGMGQRILKTADGVTTIFVYDFDGNIIAESRPDGTLTAEYLYLLGNRIARVDVVTETFSYYLNNYLGTPLLMTDDTGKVVWEAFYKPFGDAYVNPNSELVNNFRFAGQYYDKETGLHYNYHRYYDPKTGRYLTPDPIGLAGGINLFAYAANNPVNLIDPFGLEFSDIVPGIRKAFVEGAKGGTYAVGEATKATSDIAIHGHPLAKVAIGVAAVSEIVPMSSAIALSAISQVTSAIVISAPYSPIVTDAVHGFLFQVLRLPLLQDMQG